MNRGSSPQCISCVRPRNTKSGWDTGPMSYLLWMVSSSPARDTRGDTPLLAKTKTEGPTEGPSGKKIRRIFELL